MWAERDELTRLRRENKQLRVERGHPVKSRGLVCTGDRGGPIRLFRFMSGASLRLRQAKLVGEAGGEANQACFPVSTMARVLGVSQAGYYAWRHRPPSRHAVADAALLKRVQDRARQFAPDLRRTACPRGSPEPGRATWPQTDRAPDARSRARWRQPQAWWPDHDAARQGGPARAGPGRPQLHGLRAKPALGGGHHLCADRSRLPLSGRRAGRLEPQDRRLVDGQSPASRTGAGRDGGGRGAAPSEGRHPP